MNKEITELRVNRIYSGIELSRACNTLIGFGGTARDGNEEFADTMESMGKGLLSVASWVGGKTLKALDFGVKKLGTELSKVFDDNKRLSSRIRSELKEDGDYDFSLSGGFLGSVTSTGKFEDLEHDLDVLIKSVDLLSAHMKDVNDYLGEQLTTARQLRSAKNTSDVMNVIRKFEEIKYPEWSLPKNNNGWRLTDVLPGGKVFKFKTSEQETVYSMSGDKPSGESHEWKATKSDIVKILGKLDNLIQSYHKIKESYDNYLNYVSAWSDVVKDTTKGLDEAKDISASVINQAEGILKGDAKALAFYSGFTPRVVSYLDKYIQDVLNVFSKVF